MTDNLTLNVTLFGLTLATLIYAIGFGRRAERLGGLIFGGSVVLTWAAQLLLDSAPVGTFLAIDILTAVALAWLTLRFPEKLWPGVAAVAQTLVVVFSASRLVNFPLSPFAYLLALNVSGLVVQGALLLGTWLSRRTRDPSKADGPQA